MNVVPSTLHRFVHGESGLSQELLDRLAEELDLHVSVGRKRKDENQMHGDELIATVKKFSPFTDVYHVTSFKCYRDKKNGQVQVATVEIHDRGPDVEPNVRYSCVARSEDGKGVSGNPMPNVEAALAMVHWWDLD